MGELILALEIIPRIPNIEIDLMAAAAGPFGMKHGLIQVLQSDHYLIDRREIVPFQFHFEPVCKVGNQVRIATFTKCPIGLNSNRIFTECIAVKAVNN